LQKEPGTAGSWQILNVELEAVSLEQAIKTIAEKAGLKLMYSQAQLPVKTVTVHSPSITLHDVLWQVLDGTRLRFVLAENEQLITFPGDTYDSTLVPEQQAGSITGKVTDARSGDPLPGSNVFIPGDEEQAPIGASANIEGEYEL